MKTDDDEFEDWHVSSWLMMFVHCIRRAKAEQIVPAELLKQVDRYLNDNCPNLMRIQRIMEGVNNTPPAPGSMGANASGQ